MKPPSQGLDVKTKIKITLDLYETARQIQIQNIRRRYLGISEAELRERLNAWLTERPGAEFGDAGGEPYFRQQKPK